MTLPTSPPPSTPTAGDHPDASPQGRSPTGLYGGTHQALRSIREDYFYWTGKVTESSFALSLAIIGANWAVFGSVDKLLNNSWAKFSIAAAILNLAISLVGSGWLGMLLRKRVAYAEQDAARWEREFDETTGKSTHWPFTRTIDWSAVVLRVAKIFLPVIGGAFFLIALFTQPKPQKDESHSRGMLDCSFIVVSETG